MVHSGSLILVNNINPIYTEYASDCELTLFNGENSEILLEKEASSSLSRLIHDIGGQEEITAVSGYRTQNEQRAIYSDSLKDNGPDFTRKYVALPNHSEHQTGLAVDLGLQKGNIDFIRPDFPDEGICARFKAQAPSGGFIQRYKRGKENITGIADEPWHFRYLGCPHAELTECWHMALEEYIEEIKNIEPVIPSEVSDILRGYQKDGMAWLSQLSYLGFGGILADDMGLGKTLQVIAYIHGIKPEKPTLIVAPSALTYNWLSEINKFTPNAKTIIVDGAKEDREKLIQTIGEYEFVITSYPLLRRDIAHYKEFEFSYCFIDEAQHIKNPKTMNARSVKKINAEHKFALTGTPIENSLLELWSIFDFVMPGYLYSAHEFRNRYEMPLVKDGDKMTADSFRARIKPFMLRRMKNDVLNELPEKIENTMYAELTGEQKKMYTSYLALAKNQTLALLGEGGQGKMRILTLLMRLRQICCHPTLFDENYDKDSGKLDLLMELVTNAVESGHRILVFSQFTSMLSIIRESLKNVGIDSFYLDGKTPSYERAELSDRFNGGENNVFLISLKAGGVGLNLTGADTVIHYDPWWNPAVMEQASDRAYRIGQTKAVQVIRLAAKGTIEEKILKLQENKKNLADDIVRVNTDTFKSLSNEEILSLFS